MKTFGVTEATLGRLLDYIRWRMPPTTGRQTVIVATPGVVGETLRRAVSDSADYAEAQMASALSLSSMEEFWSHAFRQRRSEGLTVEFGVWKARSINFFATLTPSEIYGFDSFEGLKEDWTGWGFAKGHFSLDGQLPEVAPNVKLFKGWFDATLPGFLETHPQPFSFVHIDCDTYEATSAILSLAGDRFVSGTVVVFDEYFGYRGWRVGEFKAWQEFVQRRGLQYRYLAFTDQSVSLLIV